MNIKTSLLAATMLTIGVSLAGHAMAGQYSETATQLIQDAQTPLVPNIAPTPAKQANAQTAMASTDSDVVGGADVVTVRDRDVPSSDIDTFRGWWKDR